MTKYMRISEHMFNCSDRNKKHDFIRFKAETGAAYRTASKPRSKHTSRVARKKIQKMWQTQLPLCRRTRSRSLLSFCQCARAKPYHDLCFSQKPRQSQKSSGQLSNCSKDFGRHQHNQSRSISEEGNIVEGRLWSSKWKPPPSLMTPLFALQICCNLIWQVFQALFNEKRISMITEKIQPQHLTKQACIYLRQSTMKQVRCNQESTQRQYALQNKAQQLGWSPTIIKILDGDLGLSGETSSNREDFKTLVADVSMGKVGAIFVLEASRRSRSCADWHRLLELCVMTNTLIIDEDGCYDPSNFNDQLLLNLLCDVPHNKFYVA